MSINNNDLKKQIKDWIKLGNIAPEDIPSIELYMEQVTTLMDKYLAQNKRLDDDKTLTKTMINNYTKNELLPLSNKKRYTKEHIILLIYIYYLKNVVSINDIHVILKPLIDNYFGNEDMPHSISEIYQSLYDLEKKQSLETEKHIHKILDLSETDYPGSEDQYIKNLTFLSLLGYDIFMKKRLMEQIVDEMSKEYKEAAVTEKKEEKKETKKSSKKK